MLFPSIFGYYSAEIDRMHGGNHCRYPHSQNHARGTSTHTKLASSSSSPTGFGGQSAQHEHRRSSIMLPLQNEEAVIGARQFPFPAMSKPAKEFKSHGHSDSDPSQTPITTQHKPFPFHSKSTKLSTNPNSTHEEKYQMSTYPQGAPPILDPTELGESKTFITATSVHGGTGEVDDDVREAIAEAGGMGKNVIFVTRTMKIERGDRGDVLSGTAADFR